MATDDPQQSNGCSKGFGLLLITFIIAPLLPYTFDVCFRTARHYSLAGQVGLLLILPGFIGFVFGVRHVFSLGATLISVPQKRRFSLRTCCIVVFCFATLCAINAISRTTVETTDQQSGEREGTEAWGWPTEFAWRRIQFDKDLNTKMLGPIQSSDRVWGHSSRYARDLLKSIAVNLIVGLGLIYLIWQFISGANKKPNREAG